MRIDLTQAAAQIDVGSTGPPAVQVQRKSENSSVQAHPPVKEQTQTASAKPTPLPEPSQLNVSLDDKQNVIYRFTNPSNGDVVRQVPPEEILRIMRNIEDLLRESEQKLKVTISETA